MEAQTLIARSAIECHLYIELHPCSCGESLEPGRHRLESRERGLAAIYSARCRRCVAAHRFEFAMDDEIVPLGKFGGSKPSQIIDAGEFLAVADSAAKAVPTDVTRLDNEARHRARLLMYRAVAAIEEVLKFIGPDEEAVPREAITSTLGTALYGNEPSRFRRARLQAVLREYQNAAARL